MGEVLHHFQAMVETIVDIHMAIIIPGPAVVRSMVVASYAFRIGSD